MKKLVPGILAVLSLLFYFPGCETTEPVEKPAEERKWNSVPELASYDIRYIIQNNGKLYIAAVDTRIIENRSCIFETSDAVNWKIIKYFKRDIGPLAFNGDTLYCMSDSLFRYHPDFGWQAVCKYKNILSSDPAGCGDMIFYHNSLYAMHSVLLEQLATYKLDIKGNSENIKVIYNLYFGGAKFIKVNNGGDEALYVRPNYFCPWFYKFDGRNYTMQIEGLTDEEVKRSPENSMAVRNDTLFAGFKYPASIKILVNNKWEAYTDTLPRSKYANSFKPVLKTETTAIAFAGNRLFVGTDPIGVLEWTRGKGWTNISNGLVKPAYYDSYDIYDPIVFLEYFKGRLIVAYGTPGYAQWGGQGVYAYNLN